MLLGGITLLIGILMSEIRTISHTAGCLVFLGFAFGSMFSIAVDGKPNKQIVSGLIFELVLGAANAFCLASALA